MLAKDIMRRKVITVTPDKTISEVARLLIDRKITGAPVVDRKGNVVGVISQTDIVRRDRERSPGASVPSYYREGEEWTFSNGYQIEDPDLTRVRDLMTPAVLSADEDAPVEELARCMLQKHIHRIVITRHGRLCGIVTSMDMLNALLDRRKPS